MMIHVCLNKEYGSLVKTHRRLIGTFKLLVTFKGELYRIWCGVNRLGDSGVKVV